jgi:hypothetical protein
VCDTLEPQFTACADNVSHEDTQHPVLPQESENPLDLFSLTGRLQQLEREAIEQVALIDDLVLLGQFTVFYGAPNTGKTLLMLKLLIQAIRSARIDPALVYYLNVDDSQAGVIQKLGIAEDAGFHLLAEGYRGFHANVFLKLLNDLIRSGYAKGVVIILDTLKKFTDVMDKRAGTEFSKVIRRFIMQGGTCIALAHVNKKPGADGRPVYAGTTDIVEDADCAYILRVISGADAAEKVVVFENIKRRGDVCQRVAYSYRNAGGISYSELFQSVRPVDEARVPSLEEAEKLESDAAVIDAISECIRAGINTKMLLALHAAQRSGVSKRTALNVIDHYTGWDPEKHRWNYTVGERGAKAYRLLNPIPAGTDPAP